MHDVIEIVDSPAESRRRDIVLPSRTPVLHDSSDDEDLPDLHVAPVHKALKRSNIILSGQPVTLSRTIARTNPIETQSEDNTRQSRQKCTSVCAEVIQLDSSDIEIDAGDSQLPLEISIHDVSHRDGPTAKTCTLSTTILTNIDKLLPESSTTRKRKSDSTTQVYDLECKQLKREEKEQAKRLKTLEKARKAEEKLAAQKIAAVNKLKNSKKDCSAEIVVDICAHLGSAMKTHLHTFMSALGCTVNFEAMPVSGLVKFRRIMKAEFNDEQGYWIPLEREMIVHENNLVVIMKASEAISLARNADLLSCHVQSVRYLNQDARILYILEGVQALIRKEKNQRNKAFTTAVRSGQPLEAARETQSSDENYEEMVEDFLLDLQCMHKCQLVHSTCPKDTAEQLSILASDISTIPYKVCRSSASELFCTDAGQIKTGIDQSDTFEKMLQQTRITAPVAHAIAIKYKSIPQLCKALQSDPDVLQSIPKNFNVDHSATGMTLGRAISRKIWRALIPTDPYLDT